MAAAPDSQVQRAGRKLATPTPWREVGAAGNLLWGKCQGSGAKPYQVSVDVAGPVYKCSCPSRKFPCKHAVGLLLLWAEGKVDETTGIAGFAAEWAAARAAREARRQPIASEEETRTPEQRRAAAEQAAERAAQRERRVDDGLAELDRWLGDQIGQGLAVDSGTLREECARVATRLVDAQAPAVATRLLNLSVQARGDLKSQTRLVDEFGRLRLLIRGWQRRAELPAGMVANIRRHIGFTTRAEDIIAGQPGVADHWLVLGMRDSQEDKVSVRRVWLWGRQTNRPAAVLFFAAGGAALQSNLLPGTEVTATLHFHPGDPRLRAAVGQRSDDVIEIDRWVPSTPLDVAGARRQWREVLSADPWLDSWPVCLAGQVVRRAGRRFAISDGADRLPLCGGGLRAAAYSLGRPRVVCGELSTYGLRPTAVVVDGKVRVL